MVCYIITLSNQYGFWETIQIRIRPAVNMSSNTLDYTTRCRFANVEFCVIGRSKKVETYTTISRLIEV